MFISYYYLLLIYFLLLSVIFVFLFFDTYHIIQFGFHKMRFVFMFGLFFAFTFLVLVGSGLAIMWIDWSGGIYINPFN